MELGSGAGGKGRRHALPEASPVSLPEALPGTPPEPRRPGRGPAKARRKTGKGSAKARVQLNPQNMVLLERGGRQRNQGPHAVARRRCCLRPRQPPAQAAAQTALEPSRAQPGSLRPTRQGRPSRPLRTRRGLGRRRCLPGRQLRPSPRATWVWLPRPQRPLTPLPPQRPLIGLPPLPLQRPLPRPWRLCGPTRPVTWRANASGAMSWRCCSSCLSRWLWEPTAHSRSHSKGLHLRAAGNSQGRCGR